MTQSESNSLPDLSNLWQQTLQWQPTPQQQQQFQQLYQQILAGNQRLNLTRITEPKAFWEKHLWDSLQGISTFLDRGDQDSQTDNNGDDAAISDKAQALRVIDIGTGAGFPGIPIAIAHPHWHVTLLDSTRKKIAFLDTLIAQLNLKNVFPLIDRAEALGQNPQHRQRYDIALVRAVSNASVCAEYALPLLKIGGLAVLYRGQWSATETETLEPVLRQLGGCIEALAAFTTPLSQSQRHCLHLRKTILTPRKFPRPIGVPAQNPL